MKIAVSSDWHGLVPRDEQIDIIKSCDALLLAGDIIEDSPGYASREPDELGRLFIDLRKRGIRVVMTPGNHDFHIYNGWLRDNPDMEDMLDKTIAPRYFRYSMKQALSTRLLKDFLGIDVLIDQSIDLGGIKVHGTPWSPEFFGWAFMVEDPDLKRFFGKIPNDADILISHCPPYWEDGAIDMVTDGGQSRGHLGSRSLTDAILKHPNLKYVFCGHIHTGFHGETKIGTASCFNVSMLNEDYWRKFGVKVIEI